MRLHVNETKWRLTAVKNLKFWKENDRTEVGWRRFRWRNWRSRWGTDSRMSPVENRDDWQSRWSIGGKVPNSGDGCMHEQSWEHSSVAASATAEEQQGRPRWPRLLPAAGWSRRWPHLTYRCSWWLVNFPGDLHCGGHFTFCKIPTTVLAAATSPHSMAWSSNKQFIPRSTNLVNVLFRLLVLQPGTLCRTSSSEFHQSKLWRWDIKRTHFHNRICRDMYKVKCPCLGLDPCW